MQYSTSLFPKFATRLMLDVIFIVDKEISLWRSGTADFFCKLIKKTLFNARKMAAKKESHTFMERGLLYLVLQFVLFGLIIVVNQLTLRAVDCGWWCSFFPLAVQISCGVVFGIFGIIIWGWGMATLGGFLTMFPMPMDGSPLHTDGPYRFMRHPSYVGLAGMFIGGSFAFGSPIGALFAAVVLPPFFSFKACKEERYCAALYGEAWESYKASTLAGCCVCCGGGSGSDPASNPPANLDNIATAKHAARFNKHQSSVRQHQLNVCLKKRTPGLLFPFLKVA